MKNEPNNDKRRIKYKNYVKILYKTITDARMQHEPNRIQKSRSQYIGT